MPAPSADGPPTAGGPGAAAEHSGERSADGNGGVEEKGRVVKSVYSDLPDYAEIVKFRDGFDPAEAGKYEWVELYAKDRYRQLSADFDYHDAKAGFVITFIGGGFGVLTVGSLAMPAPLPWWVVASLAVPIVAALYAVHLAIESRKAVNQPAGPTVQKATEFVGYFGDRSRDYFLGEWHFANEILRRVNDQKAELSSRAGRWAFRSICLLTVPFAFGILWRAIG